MRKTQSLVNWNATIGIENHFVTPQEYREKFNRSTISYDKLTKEVSQGNLIPITYYKKQYQNEAKATINGLLPRETNINSTSICNLKYPCFFQCNIDNVPTPFASVEFHARSQITNDVINGKNHGIACVVSDLVEEKRGIEIGKGYHINITDDPHIENAFNYTIYDPKTYEAIQYDSFDASSIFKLPGYSIDDVITVIKQEIENLPDLSPDKKSLDSFINAAQSKSHKNYEKAEKNLDFNR